ncbi:hypothetical protein AO726_07860 [Pseudomonas sp. TTU2014-080ASC]|nr:hypothetical protein AO726_07860 [Pseudomonas sp. TTU2014-080ASC]
MGDVNLIQDGTKGAFLFRDKSASGIAINTFAAIPHGRLECFGLWQYVGIRQGFVRMLHRS